MRRVGAHSYYFFSDGYYDTVWSALEPSLLLGEVLTANGELASAALFFSHDRILHYHLAGSVRDDARQGVNNLLLDGLVEWGTRHGIHRFHLGGGLSEADPLFKFKASLGRDRHEFWLGRSVISPDLYDRLVVEAACRSQVDPATLAASGFFPAYRAPATPTPVSSST